jgi:hypothetical protein
MMLPILILQLVCIFQIIRFALRPQRTKTTRLVTIALFVGTFFIPYGWMPMLLLGGWCWADNRAG